MKKFKYSSVVKIICALLCGLTFFMAVRTGVFTVLSFVYEGDERRGSAQSEKLSDFTQSDDFFGQFSSDAVNAVSPVTYDEDYKITTKKLLDNKEKIVEKAYKQVLKLKEQYKDDYFIDYDEYDEDVQLTTTANLQQFEAYNKSDPREDYVSIEIGGTYYADMNVYSSDTKEILSKRFDENYKHWASEYMTQFSGESYSISDEVFYYSSFGKLNNTNVDNFSEKAVYGSDIYFILKDGKTEFKGMDKEIAKGVQSRINNITENADKVTLYLYIPKVGELNRTGIAATVRSSSNEYSLMREFNAVASKYYDNITKYSAISVILLVLSFIFGFYYFSITGKRKDEESAKLRFYDYIPLEIGLGIAGGVGVGAFLLVFWLLDSGKVVDFSVITADLLIAFGCVCWAGLFVVCSSTARYIHSDKKFYKHLLTYWILFAIWKILVFLYKLLLKLLKGTGRLLKKAFESAKKTVSLISYKPTKFKRNVILIACLWMIANILLIFFGMLFAYVEMPFITVLAFILFIAGNIVTLKKVAGYIQNLDMIIDASSRREDIMLDIETLDNSLRILAESMRYTNAELQNAINKAVKDERLRTELITNVSHDLKTPLTSIITYVDLLSKCDIKDEKAQEYIKVLDEKGGKLKRLIDDLIEASKVSSGNVTINPAPMNLSELCLQATVDAQSDFEKAGLNLIVKQGEKPIVVFADGTKTNRIIENLLSNARKYSAKASRVYVNVYEENGKGVFEIKNISAKALDITPEELTERFVRGDESRSQEGNGLGLSIAKELTSLQNGRLELSIDGDLFKAKVLLPIK
ncbi:MAG: HAMP domain-containing histidine kinase [Eubacterium sp.]|nr:HAMP domain-containing histidine kinase [Eubacterium sp.]